MGREVLKFKDHDIIITIDKTHCTAEVGEFFAFEPISERGLDIAKKITIAQCRRYVVTKGREWTR